MNEKKAICSKCGDEFDLKNGKQAGVFNYCGYCAAVLTDDQSGFPPKITQEEFGDLQRTRGAHITRRP